MCHRGPWLRTTTEHAETLAMIASSSRLTASAVRDIKLSPRSNLLIVEVDTHAVSASSRTPIRKAARAILH